MCASLLIVGRGSTNAALNSCVVALNHRESATHILALVLREQEPFRGDICCVFFAEELRQDWLARVRRAEETMQL